MTPIETLRAMEAKATPGPWTYRNCSPVCDEDGNWFATGPGHDEEDHDDPEGAELAAQHDAALIATLRTVAPELLALWEAVEAVNREHCNPTINVHRGCACGICAPLGALNAKAASLGLGQEGGAR